MTAIMGVRDGSSGARPYREGSPQALAILNSQIGASGVNMRALLGLRGLRRRGLEYFLDRRVFQNTRKGRVGFRGIHVLIAFVAGFAEIDDATIQVADLAKDLRA